MKNQDYQMITNYIRKNYANIAQSGSTGSCCSRESCCGTQSTDIDQISEVLGYTANDMKDVSEGSNLGLGCGNPLAHAALKQGEIVLDLGSGGGFDCFIARRQVTESGKVIGVDMTAEMISLARSNATRLGYTNVEFLEGSIENLPIDKESIDVIISNCVINLSLDKQQVFHEAFRVLKPGGRLAVSDVLATAELPASISKDLKLFAGCVAGAEHVAVVEQLLAKAGFVGIKLTPKDTSKKILFTWVPSSDIDRYVASYIIEAVKPL